MSVRIAMACLRAPQYFYVQQKYTIEDLPHSPSPCAMALSVNHTKINYCSAWQMPGSVNNSNNHYQKITLHVKLHNYLILILQC
jgi:hypothetical protein